MITEYRGLHIIRINYFYRVCTIHDDNLFPYLPKYDTIEEAKELIDEMIGNEN